MILMKVFGLVFSMLRPFCQPVSQAMTMLHALWAKSWLKTSFHHAQNFLNKALVNTFQPKRCQKRIRLQSRYSRKYYIRGTKRRQHRIASKRRYRMPIQPQLQVFPSATKRNNCIPFDPGSFPIAIDNCASKCMTNNLKDFITKTPCKIPIQGLGQSQGTYSGTVCWKWQDDKGKTFSFRLEDVIYVKDLPFRVLSPQCWSQALVKPAPYVFGT